MSEEYDNHHGHSVAAWTGVGTILFGFLVCCIAAVVLSIWLAAVGVVIIVAGIVAGKVLSMAGYGQSKVAAHRDGIG